MEGKHQRQFNEGWISGRKVTPNLQDLIYMNTLLSDESSEILKLFSCEVLLKIDDGENC